MARTKRGKGRPKKQPKKRPSSSTGVRSQLLGGGSVTSWAWTSIKREGWKLLFNYQDVDAPDRLSFFGLPAEIRNQIYGYLFPARIVDFKKPIYDNSNFILRESSAWSFILQATNAGRAKVSTNLNPGLVLLSTCRRAYEECCLHYYGNSIFFLPPGEIANTLRLAKVVKLTNLELITSIGIKFDVSDIDLKEFQKIARLCDYQVMYHVADRTAMKLLRAIWYKKLEWIYRHSWRSLRFIHLETRHKTIIISADEFFGRCILADFVPRPGNPRDQELWRFLRDTSTALTSALMNRADEIYE